MRDIAPRFEHRLFLSATPHNGHRNSFSALLEIFDPQRFCRGVPVRRGELEQVMVRRMKSDIRALEGGFPERVVERIDITGLPKDNPEIVLAEKLDAYRRRREDRLKDEPRSRRNAGKLVIGKPTPDCAVPTPRAFRTWNTPSSRSTRTCHRSRYNKV